MIPVKKQVILTVFGVLFMIGFLEGVLSLFALVSPQVAALLGPPWVSRSIARTVPDERLRSRPNPKFPGHDRNGFRNPKVPVKANIVALGDSQTYGTGVEPEQAWPRQLEAMIEKPVYSMASGGYGPVHSLILWDEVLELEPKIVIEAVYAGNDLYDAFNLVYNQRQLQEMKSPDLQVQARVRAAEAAEPLAEHVSRMFEMGAKNKKKAPSGFSFRGFLADQSKIYGFIRRLRHEIPRMIRSARDPWEVAKAFAKNNSKYTQVFNEGQFRTIFTSEYRFSALNPEDPRIKEGHQIVLRAIKKMNARAMESNIRFIVMLIPTKEWVFQTLWTTPPASYQKLTESEVVFWKVTKAFFERNGIEYIDAMPALRAQLSAGIQPYQVSSDGHPNEFGHQAIAALMTSYLEKTHE